METEQEVEQWLKENGSLLIGFDFLDGEEVVFTFPEVEINRTVYLCGISVREPLDYSDWIEAVDHFSNMTGCKWMVAYDRRFRWFGIRNLEAHGHRN